MRHERQPPRDRAVAALRREHRMLRRAFAAILVALAPPAMVEACGQPGPPDVTHGNTGTGGSAPGSDSGTGGGTGGAGTGGAVGDGGMEASADAPAMSETGPGDAAPDVNCTFILLEMDAGIDADLNCLYTLPCGLPSWLIAVGCEVYTAPDGGPIGCHLVQSECLADVYVPDPDGGVQFSCDCVGGRRPRGLARVRAICAPTALGGYFARMAHDEAASVHAFQRMRDELAAHGAPDALIRAAERSASDEVRHARVMTRHARRLGATSPSPRVRRPEPRSLEAMARENAVEGCVLETFGALLAAWQAAHAPDPALRRTFARIAADEARHAALSWAVARWAEGQLDLAARRRIATARSRALSALRRSVSRRLPSVDAGVGWPDPGSRAALLDDMIHRLGLG
jgi:hypothetical protein